MEKLRQLCAASAGDCKAEQLSQRERCMKKQSKDMCEEDMKNMLQALCTENEKCE